jgi:hypothetical protein
VPASIGVQTHQQLGHSAHRFPARVVATGAQGMRVVMLIAHPWC